MGKYLVKVLPTDECGEDEYPNKNLIDGEEADGFVLVLFQDGDPYLLSVQGANVMNIANAMFLDDKNKILMRAAAVAEGMQKAHEIKEANDKENAFRRFANYLEQ